MVKKNFERFWVTQAGILIRQDKCLILELADKPGNWDIPGGRLDEGEMAEEAFRREIKEEIGIDNFKIGRLVDYDIWYPSKGNPVCAIVMLIRNEKDNIVLSHEHTQYVWITRDEIDKYNFFWPNAKRMLIKGFKEND